MAKKYLDPKADVTFKKVFGEHKNLVISLLNALLPLDPGKQVESIEYLPPELVPRTPIDKDTSVNVRCLEFGPASMRFTNVPEANALLRPDWSAAALVEWGRYL